MSVTKAIKKYELNGKVLTNVEQGKLKECVKWVKDIISLDEQIEEVHSLTKIAHFLPHIVRLAFSITATLFTEKAMEEIEELANMVVELVEKML